MPKVMRVMDNTGDSTVAFDADVDNEAKTEARKFFDGLMAKGTAVFALNHGDDKRVRSFDELGAENLVVPRIAGG